MAELAETQGFIFTKRVGVPNELRIKGLSTHFANKKTKT